MKKPGSPSVLVEPSDALPLVWITVSARTGALEDPAGKEGLTRATTRLMRRTGGGLSPHDLDVRIDSLGASLTVDISQSVAAFHAAVITRSLDQLVDLLVDVLARPGFSEGELGHLKRETEGELVEMRDSDASLARRWFRRKLFEGHPYGRPISGTLATTSSFTRADIVATYEKTVAAQNLVFAFSGDIDQARGEQVAQRVVSALPAGEIRHDTVPEPEARPGRRLLIVDKPERTQTQILIGGLGSHPRDEDHVALHVANTIFGGTFTARLTQEVRAKRGWSYGAYSSLPFDRRRRAFSMWTFPKATDAAPCIRLELELLKQWHQEGVTAEELEWAKSYLVRSHAFAVDTAAKRVGMKLDADLYDLPRGYYERYEDNVRAVTLGEANAAIQRRISLDDLLVTVVGTESEIGADVQKAIDDLAHTEVVPFDSD